MGNPNNNNNTYDNNNNNNITTIYNFSKTIKLKYKVIGELVKS